RASRRQELGITGTGETSQNLGVLLLLAGVAADKLFDNMPELVLGAILGAALLVVALPYMRRVWRGLTEVIKSRLHPPVVRVAESAMFVVLTPTVVSTHPFGRASSSIRIVVAVNDQSSKRLDGVPVTFQ